MIQLPTEFSELLKLLNEHEVKYLVVGGYAVAYHGYPRTTGDIDLWIERTETNAQHVVEALRAFGFDVVDLQPSLFAEPNRIVRMGFPPLRVEIMTSVSGVEFAGCYEQRVEDELGGTAVPIIGLGCLKKNKRASGRPKDLADLDRLP